METKNIIKWLFLTPVVALGLVLLLILPLLVLVKGTVMSYQAEMSYLTSLLIGGFAAFVVLVTYFIAIDRVAGRQMFFNIWIKLGVAAIAVLSFILYSMYVLNDENVKNKYIASQYTQTHPVLRLGLQSWSLFDRKLVVTDIARKLSFYRRNKIRVFHRSLHFPQKYLDNKVYALDIRTKRRGKFRNWITQVVFRMMGFKTLRHKKNGTGDHLHVELPLRKSDKRAILIATRGKRRNRRNRSVARNIKRARAQPSAKQKLLAQRRERLRQIEAQKQSQQAGVAAVKPTQELRSKSPAESSNADNQARPVVSERSSVTTTNQEPVIDKTTATASNTPKKEESELVNDDNDSDAE